MWYYCFLCGNWQGPLLIQTPNSCPKTPYPTIQCAPGVIRDQDMKSNILNCIWNKLCLSSTSLKDNSFNEVFFSVKKKLHWKTILSLECLYCADPLRNRKLGAVEFCWCCTYRQLWTWAPACHLISRFRRWCAQCCYYYQNAMNMDPCIPSTQCLALWSFFLRACTCTCRM